MRIAKRLLVAVAALAVCAVGTAVAQQIQITSGPTAQQVNANSATITWGTNVNASTMVLYGTNQATIQQQMNAAWPQQNTAPSGAQPGLQEQPWGGTTHTVQLTNLQPGTTYYYVVRSTAAQGTGSATTSNISSFSTSGSTSGSNAGQQALAIISGPSANNVTAGSATVIWDTNAEGSNEVMYGTDPNTVQPGVNQDWPEQSRPISGSNPGLAEHPWGGTHHSVTITGLQPNTTYYFIVRSTAGKGTGTAATSQMSSFRTTQ